MKYLFSLLSLILTINAFSSQCDYLVVSDSYIHKYHQEFFDDEVIIELEHVDRNGFCGDCVSRAYIHDISVRDIKNKKVFETEVDYANHGVQVNKSGLNLTVYENDTYVIASEILLKTVISYNSLRSLEYKKNNDQSEFYYNDVATFTIKNSKSEVTLKSYRSCL